MQKRLFDLVVATMLLALVAPLIMLGALGAAIALRSWPFFSQQRVGRHGRSFRFVKIRTLPPSTPCDADKYALARLEVPRFCRALRRLHLDELPQLLLVLCGHMSLVGPRPEMPRLHAYLDTEFASCRTAAKPGCTGLWQVGQACHRLIREAPEYDLFYLRHQSLRFDIYLLYRTVRLHLPSGQRLAIVDVPTWAIDHPPAHRRLAGPVVHWWTDRASNAREPVTPFPSSYNGGA